MGAIAALPMVGKLALGVIGGAAASRAVSGALKTKQPPPPISSLPDSQQISREFQPINFTSVLDELTGDKLEIVRGVDGKISLKFANNNSDNNSTNNNSSINRFTSNRLSLEAPANVNLPAIRPVARTNINQTASEVIALSAAMTRLGTAIENLESTSPYLIPQNQELINSYKAAVSSALERGFDFKQQAIDKRLNKMGLADSSTALGVEIALARERATAYAEAELKQAELAQGLKQQAIANLNTSRNALNDQANTELNRFATETSNSLQQRGQDMQTDVSLQSLEQQRATEEARLGLQRNEIIQGRVERQNESEQALVQRQNEFEQDGRERQNAMAENRRLRLMEIGTNLFNSGNQEALSARQIDNNAISSNNQSQYQRYAMTSDPRREMLNTFVGSALGTAGQRIGSSLSSRLSRNLDEDR